MPNDIAACLRYLVQIPSDESKRRGFTVIIDSRDGSWSNLVTLLGCLKVIIRILNAMLQLKKDDLWIIFLFFSNKRYIMAPS